MAKPTLDDLYTVWVNAKTNGAQEQADKAKEELFAHTRQYLYKLRYDDDSVQNACIVILRKLDAFKPQGTNAFRNWVSSIHSVTTMQVQYPRHPIQQVPEAHIEKPAENYEHDWLYSALANGPVEFQAIAAYLISGYSVAETAGLMKLPITTLKSRIKRYIKKIRKSLSASSNRPTSADI